MTDAGFFERTLTAAQAGEPWAFSRLYEDLKRPVVAYARLRGASDPDDVTSEVFLQVFRELDRFSGDEEGFRAWVFTIAHRRVLDAWRRSSRRPAEVPLDADLAIRDERADVEHLADLGTGDVDALLQCLTAEQRDVVLLRIVADLPLGEVAAIMGRSVTAVTSLQHRALRALRNHLGGPPVTGAGSSAISGTR